MTTTASTPAQTATGQFTLGSGDAAGTYVGKVYAVPLRVRAYKTIGANTCTNAGLTTSPPSPGATGVSVTMTGSSSSCPNPRYRFWVKDPGSRWSMLRRMPSPDWRNPRRWIR